MNLDKLKEHVALPDWERQLLPLFLFKGTKPYAIRASFNCAYAMYLSECESFRDGIKLLNTGAEYYHKAHGKLYFAYEQGSPTDISHLCGRHAAIQHTSLRSIFERLRSEGGIKLTDSLDKGFSEYIEWLSPGACLLQPVAQEIYQGDFKPGVTAWWRSSVGWDEALAKGLLAPRYLKTKPIKHRSPVARVEAEYPFIQKTTDAHRLLLDVHTQIPSWVPKEIRGDLCQDLIVAVLSGETKVENIPDVVARYATQARKLLPDRWKTVSLDATIEGTDGLRYVDTLHSCEPDFAPPLIEKIEHQENALGLPAAAFRHGDFVPDEHNARRVLNRSPRADRMEGK